MTSPREAFEAYLRKQSWFTQRDLNRRDRIGSERFGEYCDFSAERMWKAWCEALALPPEAAPAAPVQGDAQDAMKLERDTAVSMLAEWCVAVEVNGTSWDDWDEHYKDAMYRPGPLRKLLDAAIAAANDKTDV